MRTYIRYQSIRGWAIMICLALGVGFQTFVVVSNRIAPIMDDFSEVEGRTAIERSAYLAFGADFAEVIAFLRSNAPDSALVALPPTEISTSFGHNGLMQYYVFPRRVTNCPSVETFESCALNLGGPSTYILRVKGFPPEVSPSLDKHYIPLREGFGVYAPAAGGGQ